MIKWSVLDQSPISEGSNAVTALANTAKLAQRDRCDEWVFAEFQAFRARRETAIYCCYFCCVC